MNEDNILNEYTTYKTFGVPPRETMTAAVLLESFKD